MCYNIKQFAFLAVIYKTHHYVKEKTQTNFYWHRMPILDVK